MDPLFQLRIDSAKIWNDGWGRCLEPRWQCESPPIKAHSIQNARIIDRLAQDGHVVMIGPAYHPKSPPLPEFRSVGRNKATTFEGLCAEHDREIFRRIDTESINTDDQEQLFLLAYRAATRGLYTTMAVAYKTQLLYLRAVDLGLLPSDRSSPLGMFAVERMTISWHTYRYRLEFDEGLIAGRYDKVHHSVVEVPSTRPTIAVSNLFSVDSVRSGEDRLLLSLSVLPHDDGKSVAVFSWRDRDDVAAQSWLKEQIPPGLNNATLRRRLSRLVLANCENIIFAPWLVESLATAEREQILAFFVATALGVDDAAEAVDIDLFA